MRASRARLFFVGALGALLIWAHTAPRISAGSKAALQVATEGFGRGRVDRPGIVAEAEAFFRLPRSEPATLEFEMAGAGTAVLSHEPRLRGDVVRQIEELGEMPKKFEVALPAGGDLRIEGGGRVRLIGVTFSRSKIDLLRTFLALAVTIAALAIARHSFVLGVAALGAVGAILSWSTLAGVFLRVLAANLMTPLVVLILLTPLMTIALFFGGGVALTKRGPRPHALTMVGFAAGVAGAFVQLSLFEQPLLIGDPFAYFDIGGNFALAVQGLGSPLRWGFLFDDVRPYFALLAPGSFYGLLRFIRDDVTTIYLAQACAIGVVLAGIASIARRSLGQGGAALALGLSVLHPTFSILPGLIQPEPFILASWVWAARLLLTAESARGFLGAGVLFGLGLALHPQGLSFLLVALALCLLPWIRDVSRFPSRGMAFFLGLTAVALPAKAAEEFARPTTATLNEKYGFFAYTSPYPLGFWLFLDTNGWQGSVRMEDTEYVKGFRALEASHAEGEAPELGVWPYTILYSGAQPVDSARAVLTNLHRLWNRADNPFRRHWFVEAETQTLFHRALVVLFVVSLPMLLSRREALLVIPFVILSMTYPAYHVFNKYATPALPFIILGATFFLVRAREIVTRLPLLVIGLGVALVATLIPATLLAAIGSPSLGLMLSWWALWAGVTAALVTAKKLGTTGRARWIGFLLGVLVLPLSSIAASKTDTARSEWSAPLTSPFEATCNVASPQEALENKRAWLFFDLQVANGDTPPLVSVNGVPLQPLSPTMPVFGLATYRGGLDQRTFRQLWKTPAPPDSLARPWNVRVTGSSDDRVFGDIRTESAGPWLSLGEWPNLTVYRLMHEGQYRLPVFEDRTRACASRMPGTPGIFLVEVERGAEEIFTRPPEKAFRRLF